MDNKSILKYIDGRLDGHEREKVLAWIEASPENAARFARIKAERVFATLPDTTLGDDVSHGRRLARRIAVAVAAAVLLLPLLGAAIYKLVSDGAVVKLAAENPEQGVAMIEYVVNPGVKGSVTLPDGSRVRLNSGSTLSCPARFDSTARRVRLSGEGYFEVAGNHGWPMIIDTDRDISVVVRGTEFNMTSYDNDSHFSLTLISGELELVKERTGEVVRVRSSQEIRIANDYGQTRIPEPDIRLNTAWKDGYLMFENTPLDVVIRKLERWYGVTITVGDRSILDSHFTASFESESITRVLEILRITSGIRHTIEGNRIELSR